MNTKLTLSLNNQVIERAKSYARKKNTSLSKLIEAYLHFLTSAKSETSETSELVKSLSGILNQSKTVESKDAYKRHISQKYSK